MKIVGCLISLLLVIASVTADIYSYQDEQGNTVYTDQPPSDVKIQKIDVSPINQLQVDKALQKKSDAFYKKKREESELDQSEKTSHQKAYRKKQIALQKAKKRLEAAKEIRSGDVFPNKSGGFRYTAQYKKRLAEAEFAIKKTRKSLQQEENMPR